MFDQLPDEIQKEITQLLLKNQFALAKKVYDEYVQRQQKNNDHKDQDQAV